VRPTLYRWPPSAAVGRAVPKSKFYEHGSVRAALREHFVDDVQRVTWAYKLADATIRLAGSAAVPEIQVFQVRTKGGDVGDDVLSAIDRTVQFPIFFEVMGEGRIRMVAALKTVGSALPKLGSYFSTDWMPEDSTRRPLPTAIDLPTLYEGLLANLLPIDLRPGESVSEATGRMEQERRVRRDIAGLERRLRAEPQFNRKVELRRQLTERAAALAELTKPDPTTGG
jgi:hypothetical protein